MAKKTRTAKQKRATRKLVALNRRRASKPRKRRTSRKVKKRTSRRKSVARKTSRRRSSGGKKSLIDRIPILNNKTVQKVGFGLGMGALAGIILNFIPVPALQQNKALIQTGVTFAADPLAGVLRLTGLLGGPSGINIGNLLGGQNSSNGGMNTGGFA